MTPMRSSRSAGWPATKRPAAAQPGGKPALDFKFTSTAKDEAVFVNPGRADHLKRIVYRRNADGTLMARSEGESNGKSFTKDWHYFPQKKWPRERICPRRKEHSFLGILAACH